MYRTLNPHSLMSAVICQGCIWPNKPVFLIAVMSCVDPGNGFRNIKDLACLVGEYFKGYALLCGVSPLHKVSGVFPPPAWHERAI